MNCNVTITATPPIVDKSKSNMSNSAFHSAARDGSLSLIETTLNAAGSDADALKLLLSKDEDERTAFHWAAAGGFVDVCTLMLERCGDDVASVRQLLSAADESGASPLLSATAANAIHCVRLLLRVCAGDDALKAQLVNASNEQRNSALHYAASKGRDELLLLLLDSGAKKNALNKLAQTPLMRAVSAGQLRTALLLLDRGASAAHCDAQGNNVLHVAAQQFDRPMLLALLRRRAELDVSLDDKNADGKTVADLVGGADRLTSLIAESETPVP
jgi:26S proteasome non-ATPase regulatory subunit 10